MSVIKSFSVGEGDMFYIEHNSDIVCIVVYKFTFFRKKDIYDDFCPVYSNVCFIMP